MKKLTEIDVERHFGYSFVSWKIINFCFETSREEFQISTPEFCVDGQQVTKWKARLNPKVQKGEECAFHITFERTGSDRAPEIVFVDLKFELMDPEGKEGETVRYKSNFEKYSLKEIPLWSISYIKERLKPKIYKSCAIRIRFDIVVDFEDCCKTFEGPVDIGLVTLSQNLLKHYQTGTDHDVVLRIQGKDIPAHKAILYLKSIQLADAIEKGGEVIDLPHLDFETMQAIVAYFYSGNINYISGNPSILMYDTATSLSIAEIKQYYNPQIVKLESVIDVKKHTFVWGIKNFRELRGDYVTSPVLTSDYIDIACRITLYTKGDGHTTATHLSVFADLIKGTIPEFSCIVFSLMDGEDELWSERMQLSTESDKRFGFENFIKKDTFSELIGKLSGDTIYIALTVEIHTDSVFWGEKYEISYSSFPVMKYYECLSVGVKIIFHKSLFSDVTLEAEGSSFKIKANKFILSARLPVFHTLLNQMENDKLTVRNIKSNILHAVLTYIYSGVFEGFKPDEVLDVYEAAKRFSLSCLKKKCLDILKGNFNVQSVCDALVYSDERQDAELKMTALNFIRENINCFYEDTNWKSLNEKNTSLYCEVMEIVNESVESDEMQVMNISE